MDDPKAYADEQLVFFPVKLIENVHVSITDMSYLM
jgi:hypothetical protein